MSLWNNVFGVFDTFRSELLGLVKKDEACCKTQAPSRDIWEAAKLGNQTSFREFVLQGGLQSLVALDADGNTPAHFAALHNQLDIIQHILCAARESDGVVDVNSALNTANKVGQCPIHWACVGGSIGVVDFLLSEGVVNIDQQDAKECTPLISATQYGKCDLVGYLLLKGANMQLSDNEGDGPLHWAASKGTAEVVRLLVYWGMDPHKRDNFGQTPLHFACLSGDLNTVRDLCVRDNVEINVKDNNGKTPLMLSAGRRYDGLVDFLKMEILRRKNVPNPHRWQYAIIGPPGATRFGMLYLILCVVIWGYPYYALRILPLTYALFPTLHATFIVGNVLMWFLFYRCAITDPGLLPTNMPDYDHIMKQAVQFQGWGTKTAAEGDNPLHGLCHTCKTVKPPRTKHCPVCDRCVLAGDHHCPYIDNCVGLYTRHWFGVFLIVVNVLAVLGCFFLLHTWILSGIDVPNVVCVLLMGMGVLVVFATGICVWYHAAANLTTSESINWKRYSHMKTAQGHYRNPFNRGVLRNLTEFMNWTPPPWLRGYKLNNEAGSDSLTGWSTGTLNSGKIVLDC